MILRKARIALVATVLGLFAIAQAQAPKTVIIGMHQALEFLNVLYTQGGNSLSAAKLAQRGLLFLDADSNWIGELALEVPSVANGGVSADGKTITYRLRQGVTWHDGQPVTSADVRATWEMIMNPGNAVITRFGYDRIADVRTPDDYTVVVEFTQPFNSWPILFDALMPKHVIEANSPGLDQSAAVRQPIGFGPFRIVEWRTGEFVEYAAFDDYYLGRPKIDRIIIQPYPSVDALMQAISVKEVDIGWLLPVSYVPQVQSLASAGVNMISAATANPERYVMNADASQAPLFSDVRLRRALHHAVDRQQIIDQLLFGIAKVATTEWDGSPWEHPGLPTYEYDPEMAGQILDELGWVTGRDGIRVKDGQRLSFTHATTSGNLLRENVQLVVQQMFADVGVEMVIANQRSTDLFGTYQQGGVWSRGAYEMGGWSHGLRVPDPEISNRFLCSQIASETNLTGSQWKRYCNPEVDALLEQQALTFDADERLQLLYRVQEIIHDDAFHIFLYSGTAVYSVASELRNFVLHPFANFYYNPHEWELDR
jgi:peptide/nickel transport system substrate-binding protein